MVNKNVRLMIRLVYFLLITVLKKLTGGTVYYVTIILINMLLAKLFAEEKNNKIKEIQGNKITYRSWNFIAYKEEPK